MDIIQPLSNDERVVLDLCARGESIAAIGRWEEPCNSLVAKGYLHRWNRSNHGITDSGLKAMAADSEATDNELRAALARPRDVEAVLDVWTPAVLALADAAKAGAQFSGKTPLVELERHIAAVVRSAIRMLDE